MRALLCQKPVVRQPEWELASLPVLLAATCVSDLPFFQVLVFCQPPAWAWGFPMRPGFLASVWVQWQAQPFVPKARLR